MPERRQSQPGDELWHIYPEDDLKKHVLQGTICWCRPEKWMNDNGGYVVVHNSLDRREDYENNIH